jgi:hypothetical protein
MAGMGSGVDGFSASLGRGRPLAVPCSLFVHPKQTSDPTLDLADGKKIEQTLLPLFFFCFQKVDPEIPTLGLFPF